MPPAEASELSSSSDSLFCLPAGFSLDFLSFILILPPAEEPCPSSPISGIGFSFCFLFPDNLSSPIP